MSDEIISVTTVPYQNGLDRITVYWHNYNPGQGMATIVCYGCAWNCYFGAMSEDSIQKFFARADVDYLTTKLVYTQFLKNTVQHKKYVARIVAAIKEFLAKEPQ